MEKMIEKARAGLVLNRAERAQLAKELRAAIDGAEKMQRKIGASVIDPLTARIAARANEALRGAVEIMAEVAKAAEGGRWGTVYPGSVAWDLNAAAARVRHAQQWAARLPGWDDAKK